MGTFFCSTKGVTISAMKNELLASYIQIDVATITRLRKIDAASIYTHPDYQTLVSTIDTHVLDETLAAAREVYEVALDSLKPQLSEKFGIKSEIMSAYTVGNWTVGFLQYPDKLSDLIQIHDNVPPHVVEFGLGYLLEALDDMPKGGPEWKKAICIILLPLLE